MNNEHRQVERLLAYDRELTYQERELVELHLVDCSDCARQLASYQEIEQLLAREMERRRLSLLYSPSYRWDAFYAELDKQSQKGGWPAFGHIWPLMRHGLAIMTFIMIGIGVLMMRPVDNPESDFVIMTPAQSQAAEALRTKTPTTSLPFETMVATEQPTQGPSIVQRPTTTTPPVETVEPRQQAEVEVTPQGDTVDSEQDNAKIQLFEEVDPDDLIGVWQNLDEDTQMIPQIHIFNKNGKLMVHVWERCSQNWCDWGTQEGHINNTELNVFWDSEMAKRIISLRWLTEDLLQLKMQRLLTDANDSEIVDYDEELFSRMQEPAATVTPVVTVIPELESFDTDCLSYDPTALEIVNEGSSGWLLTDGRSRMIVLDNENDARTALAIVSRHNKHCFIGRSNNREDRRGYIVEYWLGDSGIKTTVSNEDCLPYDPNDLEIIDEGVSGWLLTDGFSRMLTLDNEKDATHALSHAKNYNLHCFIGRDNQRSDRSLYIIEYWR